MREYQAKRRFKKAIYSRLSLLVLVILIALLTKSVLGVWWRSRGVAHERQIVSAELEELVERKAKLGESVARLETDRGVEEELRLKFLVAEPNERVINVIYSQATDTATTTRASWRDWLAGLFR